MGLFDQLQQGLFERFIQPIIDRIKRAFGPFGKLFDLLGKFWKQLGSTKDRIQGLYSSILVEISAWRNFREAVPVRTGVINLPKAIDKTQQIIDQFKSAWAAIVDLFQQLRGQIEATGNPTEEAEQAVKDIEGSGAKALLEKFPKLAKGLEKLLGFLAIIVSALESIEAGIDDLQAIVDAIKDIREEIEFGSTIFLQQGNARKTVRLEDGSKIKIRLGALHQ